MRFWNIGDALHRRFSATFYCVGKCLFAVLLLFSTSACAIVEYQLGKRDSDVDGVLNSIDQCADSEPGSVVGRNGCSLFDGPVAGLEFDSDARELTDGARRSLDELADGLREYPGVVIAVTSHTDNRGKAVANLELSKRRVMVVVEYLVNKGIEHHRLKPYAYGESRPVVSNSTPEGRTANRRIEVELLEG